MVFSEDTIWKRTEYNSGFKSKVMAFPKTTIDCTAAITFGVNEKFATGKEHLIYNILRQTCYERKKMPLTRVRKQLFEWVSAKR